MSQQEKVRGPVSYFPSIEKKYGFPVNHWFEILAGKKELKHMDMVAFLKQDHSMGHGHANAIVAYFRSQQGI